MMKATTRSFVLLAIGFTTPFAMGATIGGYTVSDSVQSVISSTGVPTDNSFVIGEPDDKIWVNHDGGMVTVSFANAWLDGTGVDLVLETGFHPDLYDSVRLALGSGGYSSSVTVGTGDWTSLPVIDWTYALVGGGTGMEFARSRFMVELDFADFDLAGDSVVGLAIDFGTTSPGATDFAGAYITDNAVQTQVPEPSAGLLGLLGLGLIVGRRR